MIATVSITCTNVLLTKFTFEFVSLLSTGNRELLIDIKQNYSLSSIIEVISHRVLYIYAECVFV